MNKEAWAQLHERAEKIIKQGLLDEIPDAKKDALRVNVFGDPDDFVQFDIFYYEVPLMTFVNLCRPFLKCQTYDDFVSLEDEFTCGDMIQLLNEAREKWGLERVFYECENRRIYFDEPSTKETES